MENNKYFEKVNLGLTLTSIIVTGLSMYYAFSANSNTEIIKKQIITQNEIINLLQTELNIITDQSTHLSNQIRTEQKIEDSNKQISKDNNNSQTIQVGENAGDINQMK